MFDACLSLGFPVRCKAWSGMQTQVVYVQGILGSTTGEGKAGQGRECEDEGSTV